MKRFFGTALLVGLVFVGAYAVDEKKPQPRDPVAKDSPAIPRVDPGDIPPRSGATDGRLREASREGVEYLQRLRKNTPFGTQDFDLAALRGGMGRAVPPRPKTSGSFQ